MAPKNTDAERLIRELVALKSCLGSTHESPLSQNINAKEHAVKTTTTRRTDRTSFMSSFFGQISANKTSSNLNQSAAAKPDLSSQATPTSTNRAAASRDLVQHCHAVGRMLSNHQLRGVITNDRQQSGLLTSSIETLLQCCHNENANVRIAADDALSRIVLCYGKSHTVPLLIELFKEIRKNGPARSLKSALKCFELFCYFLNPQKMKCRTLFYHLSQAVVKISRRDEESVQEAIGVAIPRAFSVLGQFASEQETKAVLKTFFSLLGDENGVKRRTSGICMVSICCSCRMGPDMAEWLIRGLINMLTPDKSSASFTLLLGTLVCIRYWLLALPHILNECSGTGGSSSTTSNSNILSSARRNITNARNASSILISSTEAANISTYQRLEKSFLMVVFLLFVYMQHEQFNVVTHCLEALSACFGVDSMRNDFVRILIKSNALRGIGLPLLMLDRQQQQQSDRGSNVEIAFSDVNSMIAARNDRSKPSLQSFDADDQQSVALMSMMSLEQQQPNVIFSPKLATTSIVDSSRSNSVVDAGRQLFPLGSTGGGDTNTTDDVIADLSEFDDSTITGTVDDDDEANEDDDEEMMWKRNAAANDDEPDAGADGAAAATASGTAATTAATTAVFDLKRVHDALYEYFSSDNVSGDSSPSPVLFLTNVLLNNFLTDAVVVDDATQRNDSTSDSINQPGEDDNTLNFISIREAVSKKASVRNMCLQLLSKCLEHLQLSTVLNQKFITDITNDARANIFDLTPQSYAVVLKKSFDTVLKFMPSPISTIKSDNNHVTASAEHYDDPLTLGYGCQCLATAAIGMLAVQQIDRFTTSTTTVVSDSSILNDYYETALRYILTQCLTNRSSITCRYALQALFKLLQCSVLHGVLLQQSCLILNTLIPLMTPAAAGIAKSAKRRSISKKRNSHDASGGDAAGEALLLADAAAAVDINILPGALSYWLCRIEWQRGLTSLPLALLNQYNLETCTDTFITHDKVDDGNNFASWFKTLVSKSVAECYERENPTEEDDSERKTDAVVLAKKVPNNNSNKRHASAVTLVDSVLDTCIASLSHEDLRVRDATACTALNTFVISSSFKYISSDDSGHLAAWKDCAERAEPFISLHSGHLFPFPICTSLYVDAGPLATNSALAKCVQVLRAQAYGVGLDDVRRLDGIFSALAALCQQYPPLSHTEAWFGFPANINNLSMPSTTIREQQDYTFAVGQKQLLMLGAREANDLLRYCLHLLNQTAECADLRLHRNIITFASHYMLGLYLRIVQSTPSSVQPNAAVVEQQQKISSNDINSRRMMASPTPELVDTNSGGDAGHQQQQSTQRANNAEQLERKFDAELRDQVQVLKSSVKRMFHHLLCLEYMLESVVCGYQHFSASILNRNDAALKRSLAETVRHVAALGTTKLEDAILKAGESVLLSQQQQQQTTTTRTVVPAAVATNARPPVMPSGSASLGLMHMFPLNNNMLTRKTPPAEPTQKTSAAVTSASRSSFFAGAGDSSVTTTTTTTTTTTATATAAALSKPTEAVFSKLYEFLRIAYSRHLSNADALLVSSSTGTTSGTTSLSTSASISMADLVINQISDAGGGSNSSRKQHAAATAATKFQHFTCSTLACLRLVTEIVEKDSIVNNLTTIVKSITSLMLIEPELCLDYTCSLLRKLFGLTAVAALESSSTTSSSVSQQQNQQQQKQWLMDFMDNRAYPYAASRHQYDVHPLDSAANNSSASALCRVAQIDQNHHHHGTDDGDNEAEMLKNNFTFYTLCDKVQVLSQLSSKWKEDLDDLFRHRPTTTPTSANKNSSNNNNSRQELSNQIRTFESIVVRAMRLYTLTGDAATQAKVLSLLSLLLKLRVNYNVLDGDHVILEFVIKQVETADAGHIQRFERLIPVIFHFLLLLSREQHHVANTNVNMSKVIQLLDVLMAAELPNIGSDLICQIVFLFYKETVRRLLHARANNNNGPAAAGQHPQQHWKLIAEQLETEKEYLQSIILRLVSSHTCLYVLAFMLESLKKGDLSTSSVGGDIAVGSNNNSSVYRTTAGFVFELVLSRFLRNEIDLSSSVSSLCSMDYFFHVLPDEVFQPPDSLLCQVFSTPMTLLQQHSLLSPAKQHTSSFTTTTSWSLVKSSAATSEAALLSMQLFRFFVLKTLFERNSADDLRNGIVDWWHTAKCGIVAANVQTPPNDMTHKIVDMEEEEDEATETNIAVCAFLRLHVFNDGLKQSLCGALRTLLLSTATEGNLSSSSVSADYLRLFIAQCSLLQYLLFSKESKHSTLLLDAVRYSADNCPNDADDGFGNFFAQACRVLLQTLASPMPTLLIGTHIAALQALCSLLGSVWPVLIVPKNVSSKPAPTCCWWENVQQLFVQADFEPHLILKCLDGLVQTANRTLLRHNRHFPLISNDTTAAESTSTKAISQYFNTILTFTFNQFSLEIIIFCKSHPLMDSMCALPTNLLVIMQSIQRLLMRLFHNNITDSANSNSQSFPSTAIAKLLQLITSGGGGAANEMDGSSSSEKQEEFTLQIARICALLICLPTCPTFLASVAAQHIERLVSRSDSGDSYKEKLKNFILSDLSAAVDATDERGCKLIQSRSAIVADLLNIPSPV